MDEGEDGEGAIGAQDCDAEDGVDRGGVEDHPRWGGEEQDAEVVPPGGEVAVELIGYAAEDVEAKVLLEEDVSVKVEHVEVPGEGEGQEDCEAAEEGGAEAAAKDRVDCEEDEEREEKGSAGGGLAHEGNGEACPVEIPAGGGGRYCGG